MKEIHIELTDEQMGKLKPLWIEVDIAARTTQKGAIFMQPISYHTVDCIFVPYDQVARVSAILSELKEGE